MAETSSTSDGETPVKSMDQRSDKAVLANLFQDHCPWTIEEIGRELEDQDDAVDSVARLAADGLVHRFGEFVFPTRAARRSDELHEGAL
ncbi:MAG: hypothetical protein WB998_10170 [Solirubrobacteraceae bacterium]